MSFINHGTELPTWTHFTIEGERHIPNDDTAFALWSGDGPPPPVGAQIILTINGIGPATVTGYGSESSGAVRYLGVMAQPQQPPTWWLERNTLGHSALAYGTEIKEIKA